MCSRVDLISRFLGLLCILQVLSMSFLAGEVFEWIELQANPLLEETADEESTLGYEEARLGVSCVLILAASSGFLGIILRSRELISLFQVLQLGGIQLIGSQMIDSVHAIQVCNATGLPGD